MPGNSIGVLFKVTTWGESHGPATAAVIDGCPPRMALTEEDIQLALNRRRPGQFKSSSPRKEADAVKILSGVFEGKTTGTPISLVIQNTDAQSSEYEDIKSIFRPGHGDITYFKKFGIRDYRGGGRASGRETAARVAAGVIAGKIISQEAIEVIGYTKALGGVCANITPGLPTAYLREIIAEHPLMCPDPVAVKEMEKKLEEARESGDTLGGIVEVVIRGCPAGLGEPVFDKIDADIAKALMGIGTVKAVEIGSGFQVSSLKGSQVNDPITPDGFLSNHAGGILAGITNGDEIVIRVACKPIPSIAKPQQTIDAQGNSVEISLKGRHDVSVIPRIIPVCEAMVAIVLADHLLRHRALLI